MEHGFTILLLEVFMFRVMKGLHLLHECETKKEALEVFTTLMLTNNQPTSVFNSHGSLIYSRQQFLVDNPELFWLVVE